MTPKYALAAVCLLAGSTALAAVPEDEAAKLGRSLTPIGAEPGANADGTIPAWDGGLTEVHPDFETGGHYPDPYADDEPLFVIDASNYEQHADHLSPGQIALLERYPGWRMKVYPTRRSVAYPDGIYEATRANATGVELVEGGNGFSGATAGVAAGATVFGYSPGGPGHSGSQALLSVGAATTFEDMARLPALLAAWTGR